MLMCCRLLKIENGIVVCGRLKAIGLLVILNCDQVISPSLNASLVILNEVKNLAGFCRDICIFIVWLISELHFDLLKEGAIQMSLRCTSLDVSLTLNMTGRKQHFWKLPLPISLPCHSEPPRLTGGYALSLRVKNLAGFCRDIHLFWTSSIKDCHFVSRSNIRSNVAVFSKQLDVSFHSTWQEDATLIVYGAKVSAFSHASSSPNAHDFS
jgi:hypothetical protein